MLKIVFLLHYPIERYVGLSIRVKYLAVEMAIKGHKIMIIYPNRIRGRIIRKIGKGFLSMVSIPIVSLLFPFGLLMYLPLIKKFDPDIIYSHQFIASIGGLLLGKLLNKK